jgi:hypothetical protein
MQVPWLDVQNRLKSFGGFAELLSVGISLKQFKAFDETLISQLHSNFGDWREPIVNGLMVSLRMRLPGPGSMAIWLQFAADGFSRRCLS